MKLLTHNLLSSRFLRNVQTGYPLKLIVTQTEEVRTEYNDEFLKKMLKKIDYPVLREAAGVCGQQLPENINDGQEEDLKLIHKALFDIEVISGSLVCPESGREFPINDGIPNMLRNEDE